MILSFVIFHCSFSFAHNTDSVYNGTQIKLDIASPVLIPAIYQWQMQQYEVAANVRLAKRWYPTLELGYGGGSTSRGDTVFYSGQGGFFRVGCDLNPLKKHPEQPHALLVGVRLGTSVQQFDQTVHCTSVVNHVFVDNDLLMNRSGVYADCWGEIVAGCQVEIAKVNNTAFYMGWMGRFRCLFTRKTADDRNNPYPIYIPGFGKRDNIAWGANYYLGWRF